MIIEDNSMNEIKELLTTLNTNIQSMDDKLDKILEKLNVEILQDCKKMSSHIDFIEQVYDNVKSPLNFICNSVNNLSILPAIQNDRENNNDSDIGKHN